MVKYFTLGLAIFVLNIGAAQASSMQKCDVGVTLKKAPKDEGAYEITIVNSRILLNEETYGDFCFPNFINKQTAKIEGENIPLNKEIILRYETYSAMGENGAVVTNTWSYDPEYKGLPVHDIDSK